MFLPLKHKHRPHKPRILWRCPRRSRILTTTPRRAYPRHGLCPRTHSRWKPTRQEHVGMLCRGIQGVHTSAHGRRSTTLGPFRPETILHLLDDHVSTTQCQYGECIHLFEECGHIVAERKYDSGRNGGNPGGNDS